MNIRNFTSQLPIRRLVSVLAMLILFSGHAWAGKLLDRVVAVVNDEVITLSELNQEAAPFLNQIRKEVPESRQAGQIDRARKEVLEKMIDQQLIRQEAANEHISVSEEEVDATLARIAENNNTNIEGIIRQIQSSGASIDNYRENIRMQIMRSKLIGRKIRAKTVVSDEQILAYYQDIYKNNTMNEGYHLLQFATGWGDNGRHETKRDAWKFIKAMRTRIEKGSNFSEVAREYSDLPSSSEGGDIGIFKKNELAPYMWKAIKNLQPGELSPVIETRSGFQFFMLLGSRTGNVTQQAPLEVVRENIRDKLFKQSLEKRFEKWTKELRENAYIKKML